MTAFFYFLEDISPGELVANGCLTRDVLVEHGIADTLADVRDVPNHCVVTGTARGPSGGPGVLLFPICGEACPRVASATTP